MSPKFLFKKGLNLKLSPKFLFKKALNLKLSPKFLFKIFFFKILKELTRNDHKSLNHIQILQNLGHYLEKSIPWLSLVLVLLLKWSIVQCVNGWSTHTVIPCKKCEEMNKLRLLCVLEKIEKRAAAQQQQP